MFVVELIGKKDEDGPNSSMDLANIKVSLDVYCLMLSNDDDDDDDEDDKFHKNSDLNQTHFPIIRDLIPKQTLV